MRRAATPSSDLHVPVQRRRADWFGLGLALVSCLALAYPARVRADDDSVAGTPRYVGLLSAGAPLRLTVHDELGQDRLAPGFVDALVGYILASPGRYHHGFGLGASMNLGRDGGYAEPVYAGEQLVLMPAYLGHVELARDVPLYAHLGLPILVGAAGRSFGLELGGALAYRLLAGVGVFTELGLSTYVGAHATLDVLASLELGIALEYEVLP